VTRVARLTPGSAATDPPPRESSGSARVSAAETRTMASAKAKRTIDGTAA
jgi:hypothetical protein